MILVYGILSSRNPQPESGVQFHDPDEMGKTMFEALDDWWRSSLLLPAIGTLALCHGTYVVSSRHIRSTFFCPGRGSSSLTIFLQWLAVAADGIVIMTVWRLLASTRTLDSRLRTLGRVLLGSALGTCILSLASHLLHQPQPMSYRFTGLDSLLVSNVVADGFVVSAFFVSISLLATDASPLPLVGIITTA